MKYDDLTIQKLRELPIFDVCTKLGISLYGVGKLTKRATCWYHDDSHPSMHVNKKKNIYKCFVCGKGGDVIRLVQDYNNLTFPDACDWLVKEFTVSVVEAPVVRQTHQPSAEPQEGVFRPLDPTLVQKALSTKSTFCTSLVSTGLLSGPQMLRAADRYHLGMSKDGGVVFWEIDETGLVHNGKIMFYEPNCHRSKHHPPTWVVAELKKSGHLDSNVDNPHCLFGLHLLNPQAGPLMVPVYQNVRATGGAVKSSHIGEDLDRVDASFTSFLRAEEKENLGFKGVFPSSRSKGIAIVESEKSAIICSELFPDYLWMASGGKTMLNASLFAPLGNQRIILFPDTDETGDTYKLWLSVALEATKLYKSRIHVSSILELHATPAQKSAKIDIVDFLFPTI